MHSERVAVVGLKYFPRKRLLEYSFIQDPRPIGPPIGSYGGKDFAEFVRDAFGRVFVYSGIASRRRDGRLIAEDLRTGEFIILPGLVYRLSR
jgi:hypothetical protein